MPNYLQCPRCGNSKNGFPVVQCKICGHLGCSTRITMASSESGCFSSDQLCPNCLTRATEKVFSTAWRTIGTIENGNSAKVKSSIKTDESKPPPSNNTGSSQSDGATGLILLAICAIMIFVIGSIIGEKAPVLGHLLAILIGYGVFALCSAVCFENFFYCVAFGAAFYTLGIAERVWNQGGFWDWAGTLFGYGLFASVIIVFVSAGIVKIYRAIT